MANVNLTRNIYKLHIKAYSVKLSDAYNNIFECDFAVIDRSILLNYTVTLHNAHLI